MITHKITLEIHSDIDPSQLLDLAIRHGEMLAQAIRSEHDKYARYDPHSVFVSEIPKEEVFAHLHQHIKEND